MGATAPSVSGSLGWLLRGDGAICPLKPVLASQLPARSANLGRQRLPLAQLAFGVRGADLGKDSPKQRPCGLAIPLIGRDGKIVARREGGEGILAEIEGLARTPPHASPNQQSTATRFKEYVTRALARPSGS